LSEAGDGGVYLQVDTHRLGHPIADLCRLLGKGGHVRRSLRGQRCRSLHGRRCRYGERGRLNFVVGCQHDLRQAQADKQGEKSDHDWTTPRRKADEVGRERKTFAAYHRSEPVAVNLDCP